MCNFFSAIGLRDGSIRWHPMLNSHSDLLTYFQIDDSTEDYQSRFVKLELKPITDWMDPETWEFSVDEPPSPVWCDEERSTAFRAEMVRTAKTFIISSGEKTLIVDGCWIIGGTAFVRDVRAGRILVVQDSATVKGVRGSATVNGVGGSATVNGVRNSATVKDVWGSATVKGVRDSATVNGVWGSATVKDVGGSATVKDVGPNVILDDSAKAAIKRGSSAV